ncbi:MAG: hypothetical protein J6W84_01700 [Bacteroidales bacterium]|nr:hypothetical protein [Bacteroidales bacterium]
MHYRRFHGVLNQMVLELERQLVMHGYVNDVPMELKIIWMSIGEKG